MDRRLVRLGAHLTRVPEDLGAWIELARVTARRRLRPDFLRPAHLEPLARARRLAPAELGLPALLLGALELDVLPLDGPLPAAWRGREVELESRPDGLFLVAAGVPLRARDRRTRVEYRWVGDGGDGFFMAVHPVTVDQYHRFLRASRHRAPADELDRCPFRVQLRRRRRPVVFVSFSDALAFAGWCGADLPRAEEWRRAALAGREQTYPWGDEPPSPEHAIFNKGSPWRGGDWVRYLAEVGGAPRGASPYGLQGMAGNVREWTREAGDASRAEEVFVTAMERARDEGLRVLRGGSWCSSHQEELQVEARDHQLPAGKRQDDVGFRLVKRLGA